MADNFFGFTPESFEQFARALAVAVLGPNVIGFGDGPDGGREAIFDGEVNYRVKGSRNWNGYGVIQAKYKSKPEGTAKDQKWLLDCLEKELKLFHTSKKRTPKPKYYLLITNVELTSAPNGGKAKFEDTIRKYSKLLSTLHEGAVWDANQLRVFLPNHQSLRNNFLQFLTTGDFLAHLLTLLPNKAPNLLEILTSYLTRELRQDQFARLDQTGNKTDTQLPLPKLFFDIPAAREPTFNAPQEQLDAHNRLPQGVLAAMLRDASRKLDPMTVHAELDASDGMMRFPTRYLLQGGPGSGKSTLGQFFAQIHRAALLQRTPQEFLQPDVLEAIDQVVQSCERECLPWPSTPRYPFRIDLNQFAKSLASKERGIGSFAAYLLEAVRGDHSLTHESLLNCFAHFPTLIILDGLDEVPSSSNRAQVVGTIQDFFDEIRRVNADVFVVATTRVQGYQNEFVNDRVEIRYVMPLSAPRALRYARAYADARYGKSEPAKADRIVKTIDDKAAVSLTSHLLSTPLQVTFLATVVAAKGNPSDNRWQLYRAYYETIYDRELQKAVPPYDIVLGGHPLLIARLHQIVGFWLQYLGETTASSSTGITEATFQTIAAHLLDEKGYKDQEHKQCFQNLLYCARERLIFLTSRVAGELAFEVRSLQEFMAAECLMTGDSKLIKPRLSKIAGIPYWRNTLLFAAHKCFADSAAEQFQDTVCVLPDLLNGAYSREKGFFYKPGSDLALDLLQSGATASDPRSTVLLARNALEVIESSDVPPGFDSSRQPFDIRLESVHSNRVDQVFHERLQARIGQASFRDALGAWPLLLRLGAKQIPWAQSLASRKWPQQIESIKQLVPYLRGIQLPQSLQDRMAEPLLHTTPSEVYEILKQLCVSSSKLVSTLSELYELLELNEKQAVRIPISLPQLTVLSGGFQLTSADLSRKAILAENLFRRYPKHDPRWLPLFYLPRFQKHRTLSCLISILDKLASSDRYVTTDRVLLRCLPWPMGSVLSAATSREKLHEIASQLGKRARRVRPNWLAMERQMMKAGIAFDRSPPNGDLVDFIAPLHNTARFAEHAVSGSWSSFTFRNRRGINELATLRQRIKSAPDTTIKAWLAAAIFSYPWCAAVMRPTDLRGALEYVGKGQFVFFSPPEFADLKPRAVTQWINLFSAMGRHQGFMNQLHNISSNVSKEWIDALQSEFLRTAEGGGRNRQITRKHVIGILSFMSVVAACGKQFSRIPADLLDPERFSQSSEQFAALLVRLSQQTNLQSTEIEKALQVATEALSDTSRNVDSFRLFETLDKHLFDSPALEKFLIDLRRHVPDEVPFGQARCDRLLRKMLELRPSGLHQKGALRQLYLPDVENLAHLTTVQSSGNSPE